MNKAQNYLLKFVFCFFCGCSFIIFSLFAVSCRGKDGFLMPVSSFIKISELHISAGVPFHTNNKICAALLKFCENLGSDCDGDDKELLSDSHKGLSVLRGENILDAVIFARHFNAEGSRSYSINLVSLVILYHSWKAFLYS